MFSEELVEGPTVKEILSKDGSFPIREVIRLGSNVCEAIGELWSNRKIHRDIKPENVIRRIRNNDYVLLDPGIAFDLEDDSLTASGLIPHTPGFLAPEQINPATKRDNDLRADFFLLGILLYIALTSQHPFIVKQGQGRKETIRRIAECSPPNPKKFRDDIPDSVCEIVMRLLEKKKHLRFRDCEQLQTALAAASEN